ncbi:MAG: DUF3179 domain-containing protein [Anaerolinea sp.]|nr:DUF3179 domain-containing protein [Anaerolinea sp.]
MKSVLPIFLLFALAACAGQTGSVADGEARVVTAVTNQPTPVNTETPAGTAVATTASTRIPADQYADLEIITLLPPDAIPAIFDPQFLTVTQADEFYDADELVMGVVFNDEARAYSIPYLSNHEIVNDTVGGVKIAVTW